MSWKENAIMYWDGRKVSDHNRSPLEITPEEISRSERMVDGTMRKYRVAVKRSFSCSWENLPSNNNSDSSGTVDGGMSGEEMKAFYDSQTDPFTMVLRNGQGEEEGILVYFDEFTYSVSKRGQSVDLWEVEASLVEV